MPKGFVTHPIGNMPDYSIYTTSDIARHFFLDEDFFDMISRQQFSGHPMPKGEVPLGVSFHALQKYVFDEMQQVSKYKVVPPGKPRPKFTKMQHYYMGSYRTWKMMFYVLERLGMIEPARKGFQISINYAMDDMNHTQPVRVERKGGETFYKDSLSRGLKIAATYRATYVDPISKEAMELLNELMPESKTFDTGFETAWTSPYDAYNILLKYNMLPQKKPRILTKKPAFLNKPNTELVRTIYDNWIARSMAYPRKVLNTPDTWDIYWYRNDITFREKEKYTKLLPNRKFYQFTVLFLKAYKE